MYKQVARIALFIAMILIILGTGCGYFGHQVVQNILQNQLQISNFKFQIFRWCFNGLPFVDQLETLLDNKTYLVLLQNNRELRPSGGFMGSYARFKVQDSGLKEFAVQDIYVPDGQIVGHVDSPPSIQQAFGQGSWRLRDSNWDPDFTVAAPQIAWFFDQGGERVDGIVAVNLSLVNSLLSYLGEIKPTDYSETVSVRTFYDLAQKYAEVGFFPGSTAKRDFLGAVGEALFKRIKQIGPMGQIRLIGLIYNELKRGEILIWFKDENLQKIVEQRNWDGGLDNYSDDYLYIVETNLGANKANCCVGREVRQEIEIEKEVVTISYRNNNPLSNPAPPAVWGGDYINYLRIIIPQAAQVQRVQVGDKVLEEKLLDSQYGLQQDRYQVEDRGRFKTIGFWAVVPTQSSIVVELNYDLRFMNSVLIKHQPGSESWLYRLIVDGKIVVSDTIDRDRKYSWTRLRK